MEDKIPEFEEVCGECGEKTRKRYVGREDEYLVYECSLCGNKEEIQKEELEDKLEYDEWEEEWEE